MNSTSLYTNPTFVDENVTYHIEDNIDFREWIFVISIIFYCIRDIEAIFGFLGNSMVVYCVWRYHFLRTKNNILVVSLAISDILMNISGGLLGTIIYFTATINPSSVWISFCMLKEGLALFAIGGNIFSIFLISLDRFTSITFPIWYITTITSKVILWFVLGVWLCLVIVILAIIHYARYAIILCIAVRFIPKLIYTFTVFLPFISISIITVLLYIRIARVAWVKSKNKKNQVGLEALDGEHSRKNRQQFQILQLMGLVLGVYFALYLPAAVLSLCPRANTLWYNGLARFISLLYCANAVVNPFIYALKNEDFKRAFYLACGK